MFYPDNDTGIDVMPEIATKRSDTVKWFTKGGKGIAPTVPGQDVWNIWQAELLNILNLANIKPDKTKLDQIAQAIKLIASAAVDNKIGDSGYLEISKNLEEIYEHGMVAQAEARANIGIEGDIAYRDKNNTFTRINAFNGVTTFNDVTTFNKLATFTAGAKFTGSSRSQYYGSNSGIDFYGDSGNWNGCIVCDSKNKRLSIRADYVTQIIFDAVSADNDALQFSNKHINEQHGVPFTIYHTGNLDPVTSVNNIAPDSSGNVDIIPKFNGDNAYSFVSADFDISAKPGTMGTYASFRCGQILPGSRLTPASWIVQPNTTPGAGEGESYWSGGGALAGIWRVCSDADPVKVDYARTAVGRFLANRIPIGMITAFSNIKSPDGWTGGGTYVNLTCDIAGVGTDLLFTASPDDSEEYGRQLYANAQAGMYGDIIEPDPDQLVVN